MSDQIQMKALTNWYIFFRDVYLPYIAGVVFVIVCWVVSIDILSFVFIIFGMLLMSLVIADRSWSHGRADGINYTMETLVDQGVIIEECVDDDIMLIFAKDVVVYDRCNRCTEGWIYNPALTKVQGALSDGED